MPKTKYKRRSDGRYRKQIQVGYTKDGKPKYKYIYADTVRELENKVITYKQNLNNGFIPSDENMTLFQWAVKWLEIYKSGQSYNTYNLYKHMVYKHIGKSCIANIPINKIKRIDLQAFINEKSKEGLKEIPVRLKSTLSQMFDCGVQDNVCMRNVAKGLNVPVKEEKEKRVLSPEEEKAIQNVDFTLKEKIFVYLCRYIGLRRGEALALCKNDIDLNKHIIVINKTWILKGNGGFIQMHAKTRNSKRAVPVPSFLIPYLKEYFKQLKGLYLFEMQNNKPLSREHYYKFWKGIKNKILNYIKYNYGDFHMNKSKDLTPHIFRHTYTTDLYYSGMDIKTIQKILGHKNIQTTLNTYTHERKDFEKINGHIDRYFNLK